MTRFRIANRNRRGFTLVELLVVITVIGLLVALLIPAVGAARESARNSACMSNLRQLGLGLTQYADKYGHFCSGATDWRRDGCITEVGWVADLVSLGIVPGQMLCPSNEHQLTETYNDLLGMDATAGDACVERLGKSAGKLPDGTEKPAPCRTIAAAAVGSDARRAAIEKMVLEPGYNTNYTASWYLVRSKPNLDASGNLKAPSGCPTALSSRSSSGGPLHRARAETSEAPASNVPLLADGATAAGGTLQLSHQIGSFVSGANLVSSFTSGPVSNETLGPPTFSSGTTYNGASGWWAGWTKKTLQDYRKFGPVHGRGKGSCNILFADGHVGSFSDNNGDGFLNNGFDPSKYTGSGVIGFADANVELPPAEIYSAWSLNTGSKR